MYQDVILASLPEGYPVVSGHAAVFQDCLHVDHGRQPEHEVGQARGMPCAKELDALLRDLQAAPPQQEEKKAETWLRSTLLAAGRSEAAASSAVERAVRRVLGSCSDPVPQLVELIHSLAAPPPADPPLSAALRQVERLRGVIKSASGRLDAELDTPNDIWADHIVEVKRLLDAALTEGDPR